MFIINYCLNMFRTSLCPSSGEQRLCYCIWYILVWFFSMWLVAVVGRCLVGCEHYEVFCSVEQKLLRAHILQDSNLELIILL